MLLTILVFLLMLTVLVLIHELGHFFVAKKFGIKIEEFGVGLPPRAFGIKRGETIYSVNWLPIGGFVKLYGEDDAGGGKIELKNKKITVADEKRAFYAKPVWQRAIVVSAGVFMNFILAIAIFSFLYTQGVKTAQPLGYVEVKQVNEGSPAQKAGIKPGDIIIFIDGVSLDNGEALITKTREKLGETRTITLKRGSGTLTVTLVPRREFPNNEGPMGVVFNDTKIIEKKYSVLQAPVMATRDAFSFSWAIIAGLGLTVWDLVTRGIVPRDVAGPVGIAQATSQFVAAGPTAVISFMALLSLNLAVLNVLPIPALDGGRLFFILIEWILRRRVNPHFERYAHTIGMAVLLTLLLLITFHDLGRIFSGQAVLPVR